jgi:hypothetical protein
MDHPGERRDKPMIARLLKAACKARYDELTHEPLPDSFRDLLKQLEDAEKECRSHPTSR